MTKSFKAGDHVKWDTPQGQTSGTVVKKETGTTKAGGHTAKATKGEPQYRVKSDKSGKEAVHKPEELKKG
ncbi:DUF2945 domain-containing protein [Sphingomonas lenta]|uniref:Hypervirulence associated protein TUDOR domain-containing protein n=1 Tax=Sphingomonas lenta TaxID=1141887 RepID=A0A2A2SEE2_9SPHN|nr:DUF2945 domain-containing protein [Sphingomonas lenta]PAX07609.1 hypothetical protein CKY28_08120 [Sphingomonas lenta]